MSPLLRVTLAFALGLLPGLRWAPPATVVTSAVVIAMALLAWRRERLCISAAFLLLGVAAGALRVAELARDCRATLDDGARVQLIGVPVALPVDGQAVTVRAIALHSEATERCSGVVLRVHVPAQHRYRLRAAALGTADAVAITGRWLVHPRRHGWPQRAEYTGAVLADSIATAAGARAGVLTRFRAARQSALRQAAPQQWPLAEALLLAQRSGLTTETRTTWVAAGLVHLLAISGMHVGLIATGLLALGSVLGVPRQRAGRAALLTTAAYVLLLGAPYAALRALLQAALLLLALELQRPAEPFTLVAAAAFVILLIEPLAVLDPGFQLSFAGITGLISWRRPLSAMLPRIPSFLRDGIAAGVAASVLTTPIAALHFGQAAWIGVIATVVATPVLATALAVVVGALLLEAALGTVPVWLTHVVETPLAALGAIASAAARVPGGHVFVAPATVLSAIVATIVIIVVRRALAERAVLPPPSHAPAALHEHHAGRARRARLRFAIAGATGLVVVAWAPTLLRVAGEQVVEIHAIDVGQGDAFAVRTPRGRWFLIDAGPRTPRADAGRERVTPYLQRRGVRRIDAVILTHPDADHIGGAAAVLEAFDVGIVIDPGLPAGKDMYIDLLAAVRSSRERWIAARAGMQFRVDDVIFEFLYPPRTLDALRDANDNSVVFRLGFGSFAALFLGDAPAAVEEELVVRHGARMRVTVLKVAHHGSATSTSEVLLDAARPAIALVSAGQRNRYGHPAPSVLRRLARHDVRVLRTDQLGNVTVRAQRDGRLDAHARR